MENNKRFGKTLYEPPKGKKMINGKKVIVIMPAYNAEKTLKQTYDEIYKDFVDEVILVDDNSQDNTKQVSKELNITTIVHKENKGFIKRLKP